MFIHTQQFHPKKRLIINTDSIDYIEDDHNGTVFHLKSGSEVRTIAVMEDVVELLTAYEKRKTKIETGTVNVKIVNPR